MKIFALAIVVLFSQITLAFDGDESKFLVYRDGSRVVSSDSMAVVERAIKAGDKLAINLQKINEQIVIANIHGQPDKPIEVYPLNTSKKNYIQYEKLLGDVSNEKIPVEGNAEAKSGVETAVIAVRGSSNVLLRDIAIRSSERIGFWIDSASENIDLNGVSVIGTVNGILIGDSQYITSEGNRAKNIKITNCQIESAFPPNTKWKDGYADGIKNDLNSINRGAGIIINATNALVENCTIRNKWDGIRAKGQSIVIRNNYVVEMQDDGIELESSFSKDIAVFYNKIIDSYSGVSMSSNVGYGIFLYKNLIMSHRAWLFDEKSERTGYAIKFGNDWLGRTENLSIIGNVIDYPHRLIFIKKMKRNFYSIKIAGNYMRQECGHKSWTTGKELVSSGIVFSDNWVYCMNSSESLFTWLSFSMVPSYYFINDIAWY